MNQPMVVTNVRIPQADYRQIKAIAGELGMSVNEFFIFSAKNTAKKRHISMAHQPKTIYDALDAIIGKPSESKPMGWSKEDEAIYSI